MKDKINIYIEIGPNIKDILNNAIRKTPVHTSCTSHIIEAFDFKGIIEESLKSSTE